MGQPTQLGAMSVAAILLSIVSTPAEASLAQCPWNRSGRSMLSRPKLCPGPVDDKSGLRAETPWTREPACVVPTSLEDGEKFCLYTFSSFNEGSGLSLVVTPELAASLVDAVQHPTAAWKARKHLQVGGQPPANDSSLPYEIRQVPGKGKGVVATRKIDQFESVMVSFPAIIADNIFFPADPMQAPPEGPRLCQHGMKGLRDRDRVLSLAASGQRNLSLVEDIIRTNAFGIPIGARGLKGLYPEIARFNHGCDPNAFARFTSSDMALEAVATRDIQAGEEILISYIPLGMPGSYRTKSLANWGFDCTCSMCTASADEARASDRRRERLVELYNAMKKTADYNELVAFTNEFVDIVQTERLIPKIGEYYRLFMKFFYEFGDIESARRYGETALLITETFSDPETASCQGLREDLEVLDKVEAAQRA